MVIVSKPPLSFGTTLSEWTGGPAASFSGPMPKTIAEAFAMPAWSGTCALGVLDDDAELSAMPAAAPPSAQMAPVAATITILDLFIGIAPSLGDLGASSAVGEACGSKLNIRCETREGERRTKGHPAAPSARTVRLADGRARRAEPGRVVHGRAGGGTGPSRALGEVSQSRFVPLRAALENTVYRGHDGIRRSSATTRNPGQSATSRC